MVLALFPAQAIELYAKTGLAFGEAAYISGLHRDTVHDDDRLTVLDFGIRAKPHAKLNVKLDYQSKSHDRYRQTDWDTHKLKLYVHPTPKSEIYFNASHYKKGGVEYLFTQYAKPRAKLSYRGGTLKIGPSYRDKDYHIYDAFDSTAFGAEASYSRHGHYLKLTLDKQDTVDDRYDFEEVKFSWSAPLGQIAGRLGHHKFKARFETRHRDYFAVTSDDETKRSARHKLRGEWSYRLGGGWKLRGRAQMTWRHANIRQAAFNDRYGEMMLIYQSPSRIRGIGDDDSETN